MARTVLLADDSVTAQNMGRRILMDAGYEVITVNNGSAALKKIHESQPGAAGPQWIRQISGQGTASTYLPGMIL